MNTKYRRFETHMIEDLKTLVDREIESSHDDVDQEDAEDYRNTMREIYDCLCSEAPSLDAMSKQVHDLKNKVMALELEKSAKAKK